MKQLLSLFLCQVSFFVSSEPLPFGRACQLGLLCGEARLLRQVQLLWRPSGATGTPRRHNSSDRPSAVRPAAGANEDLAPPSQCSASWCVHAEVLFVTRPGLVIVSAPLVRASWQSRIPHGAAPCGSQSPSRARQDRLRHAGRWLPLLLSRRHRGVGRAFAT